MHPQLRMKSCLILAAWLAASVAGAQTFDPFAGYAAGDGSTAITTADFDGDGLLDLATANVIDDDVTVLLGGAGGTFGAAMSVSAAEFPVHLAACDLDKEGLLDLAVANFEVAIDQVTVLLNTTAAAGAPSFSNATYPVGSRITWVACADFDDSGFNDLVVTRLDDDLVEVLFNNGNGTFGSPVPYAAGDWPTAVAPGDFDGDGLPDLAVINNESNDVSILLNDPNAPGTFLAQITYPVGSRPEEVVAADLDRDGDLDLAVANRADNDVSVLLNDGGASFADRTDYPVGDGTLSVHAADLDCDDLLDLVADNNGLGRVAVLRNTTNNPGVFQPFVPFAVAGDPRSVVAGNFDRVGSLDLAVASQNTDTVSVLLNQATTTYTYTWTGGKDDNFGGSTDPAKPSNLFASYVQTLTANPLKDFDDTAVNHFIAHTFKEFPACVIGAELEIHAEGDGDNDGLWIGIHDLTANPATAKAAWGTFIRDLPEAGGTWGPNEIETFNLDLGNLPANVFRPATSVLDLMASGELNFYVQDDTHLDYAKLTVRSCCLCDKTPPATGYLAGIDDQFAGATEPASPSTELSDFIVAISGQQPLDFDEATVNRWFGHTFTPLIGCADGAQLTLRAMALTGDPTNDSICLQLIDPTPGSQVYGWCRNFDNLPESGGTWNTGQTATFTLDLDNLLGSPTSILDLFTDGRLDVLAQDDTKIDYLALSVNPTCSLLFVDGFESGDTTKWSSTN